MSYQKLGILIFSLVLLLGGVTSVSGKSGQTAQTTQTTQTKKVSASYRFIRNKKAIIFNGSAFGNNFKPGLGLSPSLNPEIVIHDKAFDDVYPQNKIDTNFEDKFAAMNKLLAEQKEKKLQALSQCYDLRHECLSELRDLSEALWLYSKCYDDDYLLVKDKILPNKDFFPDVFYNEHPECVQAHAVLPKENVQDWDGLVKPFSEWQPSAILIKDEDSNILDSKYVDDCVQKKTGDSCNAWPACGAGESYDVSITPWSFPDKFSAGLFSYSHHCEDSAYELHCQGADYPKTATLSYTTQVLGEEGFDSLAMNEISYKKVEYGDQWGFPAFYCNGKALLGLAQFTDFWMAKVPAKVSFVGQKNNYRILCGRGEAPASIKEAEQLPQTQTFSNDCYAIPDLPGHELCMNQIKSLPAGNAYFGCEAKVTIQKIK